MPTFKENLETLRTVDNIEEILLYKGGEHVDTIPNTDDTRGSLRVYANLLGFRDGPITLEMAA